MTGAKRRILFATRSCYLDDSNGAAVASRSLMECLARHDFQVEALSGTSCDRPQGPDPGDWLTGLGLRFEVRRGGAWSADPPGSGDEAPSQYRLSHRGVALRLQRDATPGSDAADEAERREFLDRLQERLDEFRPDVVINYGGDTLARQVRSRARGRGAAVVFPLHNFQYHDPTTFADADAVIVPSRFAASYYRRTLRLDCTPLPNLLDRGRILAAPRDPRFVTFVNPAPEKGVYPFARIADELGRLRPDIPLLVVEGRGTERTLVQGGLDLRSRGNVHLMGHTPDPRQFWGLTRICVLPSLWWENQPLVAIEAMANGIPVIGSDRGGIPEALGDAGIVLGLPSRLTPATRDLPTPEEVAPWVRAIVALWDDVAWYADQSRRALEEARRWDPEILEPLYVRFFEGLERDPARA